MLKGGGKESLARDSVGAELSEFVEAITGTTETALKQQDSALVPQRRPRIDTKRAAGDNLASNQQQIRNGPRIWPSSSGSPGDPPRSGTPPLIESYRVVVGPYATRDAADEAGKKLGRPYFVVVGGPTDPRSENLHPSPLSSSPVRTWDSRLQGVELTKLE